MTRFSLTLEQGVNFVMKSLNISTGGEIFVPDSIIQNKRCC